MKFALTLCLIKELVGLYSLVFPLFAGINFTNCKVFVAAVKSFVVAVCYCYCLAGTVTCQVSVFGRVAAAENYFALFATAVT